MHPCLQLQLERLPEYEAQLEAVAHRLQSAQLEGQRLMEQVMIRSKWEALVPGELQLSTVNINHYLCNACCSMHALMIWNRKPDVAAW
jgi:hypothetical protein